MSQKATIFFFIILHLSIDAIAHFIPLAQKQEHKIGEASAATIAEKRADSSAKGNHFWTASRDEIGSDVCSLIGKTPMVYLNKISKDCNAKIAVKLEWMNPSGSIKDRTGCSMINAAEMEGKIMPGITTLIEPTSGNTGIAIAAAAAARGYRFIAVMQARMSEEKKTILRALGAEVVLTDPTFGHQGVLDRADALARAIPNSFKPMQSDNKYNPYVHYHTTGPEIWRQTHGKVDAVVFGVGTGGTITGIGRYLREKNPNIMIFAVEPVESPLLSGGKPGPHKIQGIGSGVLPPILDTKLYQEIIQVDSSEAIEMAKRLALEEGLLSGISSGANVAGAVRVAQKPELAGKLIVTVLPSSGDRYLSSDLFTDVRAETAAMRAETMEESVKRLRRAGISIA